MLFRSLLGHVAIGSDHASSGIVDMTQEVRLACCCYKEMRLNPRVMPPETGVEMATHLVLQIFDGLSWGVPTAANLAEDLAGGLAAVVTLGKHAVERFAGRAFWLLERRVSCGAAFSR